MKPIEVILYTRPNCSLCDKAASAIRASGVSVQLTLIDIEGDKDLLARYSDDVPVIEVEGKEAFRHTVDPQAFADFAKSVWNVTAQSTLATETCVPCRGGVPPLRGPELQALQSELGSGWQVVGEHHLERTWSFADFRQALAFTNQVGAIAEAEGHHPDIHLAWGSVRITIWTHKIDGLTRSDFVLAAKIDNIPSQEQPSQ